MTPAPCPQVFYWSHLSYVSVWALLVLHAPNFWKWFVVPGGLFVLEKAVGLATSRAVGLRIVEVNLLPSKVCGPPPAPPLLLLLLGEIPEIPVGRFTARGHAGCKQ